MAESTATLAGGCFWCLEAVFLELDGVSHVLSGYSGGRIANPSYQDVCTGQTGHAEVVQITYDDNAISFRDLLDIFFTIHDPTQLNRQGADVGTQYRSAIFYHDEGQKAAAEAAIAEYAGIWPYPSARCRRWANFTPLRNTTMITSRATRAWAIAAWSSRRRWQNSGSCIYRA